MVGRLVNTSPDFVDDACNFAWMEFLRYQPDRNGNWRSWLVTVAQREAWRLDGKERDHIGFEAGAESNLEHEPVDPREFIALRADLRAALDLLAVVPDRRREVEALQVTGLKYEEIGERLGLSYTRVNWLVTEANAAIRRERERLAPTERLDAPPRGHRLQELEANPSEWLRTAIGRAPGQFAPASALLPWRQAALALDDYRREHGAHLQLNEPLGRRPERPDTIRLTVVYERDEQGWTTATIPAVPGTVSTGRNRREARENVLDALREMLAVPIDLPAGATREDVAVTLELVRHQDRGHAR
jgi:DNA-directed RNA polymerase specialized sigma24 family protein/predicted RNase H-like HicB family nuclease